MHLIIDCHGYIVALLVNVWEIKVDVIRPLQQYNRQGLDSQGMEKKFSLSLM